MLKLLRQCSKHSKARLQIIFTNSLSFASTPSLPSLSKVNSKPDYIIGRFKNDATSATLRRLAHVGCRNLTQTSISPLTHPEEQVPLPPEEVEVESKPVEEIKNGEQPDEIMKVLNVAEKNDASKRIAGLLSNGRAQMRNTHSTFNKIYAFPFQFRGRNCEMLMTSVSGHLLGYEFDDRFRKWHSCDPVELFDAPLEKMCLGNYKDIKKTLEQYAPQAQVLVIWTDCDREGEGIGFEIINVCRAKNPGLQILRAKFSEITPTAINRAWRTLDEPNKRLSDAVDVRSELDLRIGAAFTRFQTLRLQRRFPVLAESLVSYGSCQFPTLGFVVERYKSILNFIPEEFWKIEVTHQKDGLSVDFNWARVRLFERLAVQILHEKCLDNPQAKVLKVQSKPTSKWRPVALDTVEFEKLASRKLRINAKEAMKIAEKLYTQGIISYPRTETNIFPQGLDLRPLIEAQTASNHWGQFAGRLLLNGGPNPRNGKNTDQAHPPIHPTKFDVTLQGPEAKVYELIVRHFLGCCSKDAVGRQTTVEIEIAEERFVAHGLNILERNYLEVYIYDKWSDKELPSFHEGETFRPTRIEMVESQTSPPNLLTEADLISLMEKHGIGTDATHAEHIETIKTRNYVGVQDGKFVPGNLGMGLVEGYDAMGFEMSKPHLRAELEADLKGICDGTKDPRLVLQQQVRKYKQVFLAAMDQVERLDVAVGKFVGQNVNNGPPPNGPLPRFPGPGGGGYSRRGGGGSDDDDDDEDDSGPGPGGGGSNRGPRGGGSGPGAGGIVSSVSTTRSTSTYANNSTGGASNSVQRQNPRPAVTLPRSLGSSTSNPTTFSSNIPQTSPPPQQPPPVFCDCEVPKKLSMKTVKNNAKMMGKTFWTCDECGFHKWGNVSPVNGYPSNPPSNSHNNYPVSIPSPSPYYNSTTNSNRTATTTSTQRAPVASTSRGNQNFQGQISSGLDARARFGSGSSNSHDHDENKGASDIPECKCSLPAKPLTVKKDTPNKGRHFFGCSKPFSSDDRCDFFQWDDEGIGSKLQNQNTQNNFGGGFNSNSNSNSKFSTNRGAGAAAGGSKKGKGTGAARKCSVCKEVGHTKRNCPVATAQMDDDEMFD